MDKQREMFEAWYQQSPFAGEHRGFADYKHFAYAAWQAAIAAQWQPIETAPKDETPVLTYRKSRHGVDISSMYYVDGDWYWYYDGEMPADPPTHWMPLPPEPAK